MSTNAQRAAADLSDLGFASLLDTQISGPESLTSGSKVERLESIQRTAIAFRFSTSEFKEYASGTKMVSTEDVHKSYYIAAEDVEVDRATLSLGHRLNSSMAVQAQVSRINQTGTAVTRDGQRSRTNPRDGFGDLELIGTYVPWRDQGSETLLKLGLRLPTGDTDGIINVLGQNIPGPYQIQFGEGTVGVQPGIRFIHRIGPLELWVVADADIRIGRNQQGYALEDEYRTWLHVIYELSPWLELNGTLAASHNEPISGKNHKLDTELSHFSDPANSGGDEASLSLGIRGNHPSCPYGGKFVELRGRMPLYMDLNGLQLAERSQLQLGLGYSF